MIWLRMIRVAWRLAWPDVLAPWRSPLLRWRMETYGVRDDGGRILTASEIGPSRFISFAIANRGPLVRFLHWAARLECE